MANTSFAISFDGVTAGGYVEITPGTAAPTAAGTLEIRLDNTVGWTREQFRMALEQITRYVLDPVGGDTASTSFTGGI